MFSTFIQLDQERMDSLRVKHYRPDELPLCLRERIKDHDNFFSRSIDTPISKYLMSVENNVFSTKILQLDFSGSDAEGYSLLHTLYFIYVSETDLFSLIQKAYEIGNCGFFDANEFENLVHIEILKLSI